MVDDHFMRNGNSIDEVLPRLVKPDQLTISSAEDGGEYVRINDDPEKLYGYVQEIVRNLSRPNPWGSGESRCLWCVTDGEK